MAVATYDSNNFRFERPSIWHMIVGHRYVTVRTINVGYGELLHFLADEMGEDFVKPVALISIATLLAAESTSLDELDLIDYEFNQ